MVLVTGATGIVGRVILVELLNRGKSVRAAKRKTSDVQELKSSLKFYTENAEELFHKIEWIDVDFSDILSLENALRGVSEVYHCAAKVSFNPADRKEIYRVNIEGTRNLLYACEGLHMKKFCFISSVAVLDQTAERNVLDEESNFNPKTFHSAYAKSKHFSEMEVWRAAAEGLNAVIVNPGVIIGSGNWKGSSGEIFSTFEKQPYVTSGSTNYVDVRDVAKISVDLMEKNIFRERFILVSENVKTAKVASWIRSGLGLSEPKMIPDYLLEIGYVFNVLFGWLIRPLRFLSRSNIEAVTGNHEISNQKISKLLGYRFISVRDSLEFHLKNFINTKSK